MGARKTFRHGQILRLVSDGSIVNQEELRRRLAAQRLRVTQATLSRDIQELRLIKTQGGYKSASALPEESLAANADWRGRWANFCRIFGRRKICWC